MKDRLQFRHHDAIFNTRKEAIEYITYDIKHSENGLSNDDVKQCFSLYGEPTVLRYKNADDESNPHIILAIGSKSNQVEGAQYADNKFCFIDIDKTEDEIEALGDKLNNAITSLAIITRDTNTLSLSVDKNESGETLSGNVKVPATYIINGTVTNNTLKVTENGIFTYVNLNYDKDTDKLTFTVNGDTKEWNVNNDYITGGTYSIKDESLHLGMHSGKDIKIPFEDLINEWDVEGENANSPIVLTREKVLYEDDKVVDHRHGNRWQDTLKADVRIAKIPHNILNRTEDGKALYVEGTAGNIKFFKDGKEMTVADALVECAQKKLSTDNDNMIYERPDGFFAMSRLTYDAKENTLTFTTSNQSGGTTTENIELNSIKIIDDARYDRDTESLIFTYTTAKGEYKKLVVPVGSLIDEWVVNNDSHNVILSKKRKKYGDKDVLSADVRVSSLDNNILVEKGDGLYVNGEAKNIKYSDDSSVKDEISAAKESIANEIGRAKKAEKEASDAISNVVATIGSGFTADTHDTVTCKVGQLEDAINSKVSSVGKIDNSVVVDVSDANNPTVGVKLSSDKRDEKIPNLIELHENGLFAAVDLSYDESGNTLTFTTTNDTKTIKLAMNSFVDNIYYDASREVIVIEYTVNGKKMPNVEVPVRTLINEWTVSDNTDGAVKLKKTVNNSGASDNNQDILSAEVVIDKNHGDNMLINDNGALYVSSSSVKKNTADIAEIKGKVDTLKTDFDTEKARSTAKDAEQDRNIEALSGKSASSDAAIDKNTQAINVINTDIAALKQKDIDLSNGLNAREDAEKVIKADIETNRNAIDATSKSIASETNRATSAETALKTSIDGLKHSLDDTNARLTNEVANITAVTSTLTTDLENEVTRSSNEDKRLSESLTTEANRAQSAETSISNSLNAEITRATGAENDLKETIGVMKGDIEANKLKFADSTSVSLLKDSTNTVKASVKISNAAKNLLSLSNEAEGLFANVSLSYNAATNTLSVIGSDGHSSISDVKLGVGSIVDSITYDSEKKALVIEYTDSTGAPHSTEANVEDLFNEWEPDSDANNVAIELIKHNNGIKNDVLTAKVRVSAEDDNIIKIKDNMLYASNAPIVKNATDITALSGDVKTITANVTTLSGDSKNNLNELRNLENATLGLISPVGDVEYTPHADAHLISAATNMNHADVILDNKLFEVSEKVTTVEATLDLNSKELKKVEKVIGVTGNGDNDIAYPKNGHGIIDGAATYADADEKLEKALVDVKTLTSGALTPTANLHVDGVDSDKKLQVDVRLSHGKGSTMTDENLTITSTDNPEFSEENALRKVALDNGDVTSTMSGLFLSSTWDCGEYASDERPESSGIFEKLYDNSKRQ